MILEQAQGALNINLVAFRALATHSAGKEAGLTLPIVCNTSGYELPEVVRRKFQCY